MKINIVQAMQITESRQAPERKRWAARCIRTMKRDEQFGILLGDFIAGKFHGVVICGGGI